MRSMKTWCSHLYYITFLSLYWYKRLYYNTVVDNRLYCNTVVDPCPTFYWYPLSLKAPLIKIMQNSLTFHHNHRISYFGSVWNFYIVFFLEVLISLFCLILLKLSILQWRKQSCKSYVHTAGKIYWHISVRTDAIIGVGRNKICPSIQYMWFPPQ